MRRLIVTLAAMLAVASTAAGSTPRQPQRPIVFARTDNEAPYHAHLFTIDSDGSGRRRLADAASDEGDPEWSPTASTLLAGSSAGVLLLRRDGTLLRTLDPDGFSPRWRPDGGAIAYLTEPPQCKAPPDERFPPFEYCTDIWLVRPDGSGKRELLGDEQAAADPPLGGRVFVWSPSGRTIVYSRAYPSTALRLLDVATGRTSPIARASLVVAVPSWSPDSRRLAFVVPRNETENDVWTVDAQGRHARLLLRGGEIQQAQWSPNGRWLAYLQGSDEETVVVARADGTHPRRIGVHASFDVLVWSPDSTRVLWSDGEVLFVRRIDGGKAVRLGAGQEPDWR